MVFTLGSAQFRLILIYFILSCQTVGRVYELSLSQAISHKWLSSAYFKSELSRAKLSLSVKTAIVSSFSYMSYEGV